MKIHYIYKSIRLNFLSTRSIDGCDGSQWSLTSPKSFDDLVSKCLTWISQHSGLKFVQHVQLCGSAKQVAWNHHFNPHPSTSTLILASSWHSTLRRGKLTETTLPSTSKWIRWVPKVSRTALMKRCEQGRWVTGTLRSLCKSAAQEWWKTVETHFNWSNIGMRSPQSSYVNTELHK